MKRKLAMCLLLYSKEVKRSVFTRWSSLEIREVVAAPSVVFPSTTGAKSSQLSGSLPWNVVTDEKEPTGRERHH